MSLVLQDLQTLSEFRGCVVGQGGIPPATQTDSLMSFFGPLLTHPQRVTFSWPPLHAALQAYFGSTSPVSLDPNKLTSGWSGLALIVTAFKRLEMLASEEETAECLNWLSALKVAAVRRSLAFEAFDGANAGVLQTVLANLHEPVPPEKLTQMPRSRTASLSYSQPLASTSTSFERGSDATRSPPASVTSLSPEPSRPRMEVILDRMKKRSSTVIRETSPTYKRRRTNSIGQISVLPARTRDSTVSTSALSSFADFSDHQDIDPLSTSDEEEEEAQEARADQEEEEAKPAIAKEYSFLAHRVSEMTGIPLATCIGTISRIDPKDLSTINPNAPIPTHLLPPLTASTPPPSLPVPAPTPPAPVASPARVKPEAVPRSSMISALVNGNSNGHHANGHSRSNSASTTATTASSGTGPASTAAAAATKKADPARDANGAPAKLRHQRPHDPNRPSFSYSALIGQAILSTTNKKLRLSDIYDYVTDNYPYYQKNQSGWQNSIRHNLSLQPVFQKVPDPATASGTGKKGCLWTIIPGEEWRFEGGGWLKMDKPAQHAAAAKAKKGKATLGSSSSNGAIPRSTSKVLTRPAEQADDAHEEDDDSNEGSYEQLEQSGRAEEEMDGEEEDGLFSDDELD